MGAISGAPLDDLIYVTWECGAGVYEAVAGIRPVDADYGCHMTTLFNCLMPRAAAAYLGTYLLSVVRDLNRISDMEGASKGVFWNFVSTGHLLYYLTLPRFWAEVGPLLPPECCEVLVRFVDLVATTDEDLLRRPPHEVAAMRACAVEWVNAPWKPPYEPESALARKKAR